MNWKSLTENNIYVFPSPKGYTHHVVYAPLADSAFVASEEELTKLIIALHPETEVEQDYRDIIESLLDVKLPSQRDGYIRHSGDFINLSLLPNNVCNFACRYCYSASGRSRERMTFDMAERMILHFLDTRSDSNPRLLTFSIFGGGEPLLSWEDVVRPSIQLIDMETRERVQKHVITLITNGSLLPPDFIDICQQADIDLVVSFDILEDVQNTQRKHYQLVKNNIRKMIDEGIVPAINSVVTNLNVERLTLMVAELHSLFPEIKHVAFEPVIGEAADLHTFYTAFMHHFIDAKAKADEYGMKLTCTILRNVDATVDRYCPGEMALCADGSITVCPCLSSPQEPHYADYVYGKVTSDEVCIDEGRLAALLSKNVHTQPSCSLCPAKWNCGGGCTHSNTTNGGAPHPAYCQMVRSMTRYFITDRLEQSYRKDGDTITNLIGDYEQLIRP